MLAKHADLMMDVQEGTGITKLIPHLSPEGQDLLQKLLMYNPEDRISAKQALRHAFFRDIRSPFLPHAAVCSCSPHESHQTAHLCFGTGHITSKTGVFRHIRPLPFSISR